MPKLQLASDLHLEFFATTALVEHFCKTLLTDADVFVLAGDTGLLDPTVPRAVNSKNTPRQLLNHALEIFCNHYPTVIDCLGNHSYYHYNFTGVAKECRKLRAKHSNLQMYPEPFTVSLTDSVSIHCTTLWFEPDPNHAVWWQGMADAYVIGDTQTPQRVKAGWMSYGKGEERWSGCAPLSLFEQRGQEAVAYLEQFVRPGDIVVTHHLPLWSIVLPQFKQDKLTHFFVNEDAKVVIEKNRPKLWLHGHTHGFIDTVVGDTRIVCNPYGYYAGALYPKFNHNLLIDI